MMKKASKKNVQFTAVIERFSKMGEKTGWSYVRIPAKIATVLFPGNKKSFRVKGLLDGHAIKGVALLPMGDGDFILPVNASMRKGTKKSAGASLSVRLEIDSQDVVLNKEMMDCIHDEPSAYEFFSQLSKSHQNYFSKWVDGAKSEETKAKRIARILNALVRKMNYAEMLRAGF